MKYMYAYRYVFESPKWGMNLLAGSICELLGMIYIGPIVFLGYGFDVIESLHHDKDSRYPAFDTNRLMEYLLRGLWVFLVRLVVSIPIGMVVGFLYLGVWVSTGLAPEKYRAVVFCIALLLFLVILLVVSVGASLVLVPLTLRAGLTQDFGQAFSLSFIKDFIKRMWLEIILQQLFVAVTAIPLSLIGTLLCFVGALPAGALIMFAEFHLLYQLYELYLERGGTPIPLKDRPNIPEDTDSLPIVEPAPETFRPAEDS